jgi:hypothetical protein
MNASSLSCHLADLHEVYQQTVAAEELLDDQVGGSYRAITVPNGKIACQYTGCVGESGSGWIETPLLGLIPEGFVSCVKGATVPALQEMQDTGEICLPKAHLHKGVRNGHGKTTTVRSGSGLSTGPLLSVHGEQGCTRNG